MRLMLLLVSILVASCASVQPLPGPTEFLVPTADFTMRLPPFVTIEVLKNQRAPVVGTTERNGKRYRLVVLPAQAAGALRFLLNDDGTLEGSAINFAGSMMGFTYRPNPPDVQLVAEAAAPIPDVEIAVTPAMNEAARTAMDMHLARTLKDPMSAIQYAVSDIVQCRNVAIMPAEYRDSWCVCYVVNARNSMGGMTGRQLHVGSLVRKAEPFTYVDLPSGLVPEGAGRGCAGLSDRDSELIRQQVK